MMYDLIYTAQARRDIKLMRKRGADLMKLKAVTDLLREGTPLPRKYKDHALTGEWKGYRDCHIDGDWIFIYRVANDKLIIMAVRTGTHSDFGW